MSSFFSQTCRRVFAERCVGGQRVAVGRGSVSLRRGHDVTTHTHKQKKIVVADSDRVFFLSSPSSAMLRLHTEKKDAKW